MKKNRNYNWKSILRIGFFLVVAVAVSGFAPMAQNGQGDIEPLTLDFDKISESVAETVSLRYEDRLTSLESEIVTLKATIMTLTERIAKLEAIANLPTATPIPEGTLEATLEATELPTKTPNPTGYDCETFLASPYYFGEFKRGAEFNFTIQITNTGSKPWGNEVMMEWISGLKAEKTPMYAFALPKNEVGVDETVEFTVAMVAPDETSSDGRFTSTYALTNGSETFCEFEYNIYVP